MNLRSLKAHVSGLNLLSSVNNVQQDLLVINFNDLIEKDIHNTLSTILGDIHKIHTLNQTPTPLPVYENAYIYI